MPDSELMSVLEQSVHEVLVWVGFGTLVGLSAKAIMPGRDPGGTIATLLMGIGGSVIGCGLITFFWDGQRVTPISPLGFAAATGGAFVLLFFDRLLAGTYFVEAEAHDGFVHKSRRRRRRRELLSDV
ncbi:MAG TPA: GlsB/YeaQ/YmgE family stress response membrane protein [Planctomycetaceae bacterium]|nr:GlsB/YeaQ/YmgE family stress response membrane protein [Planctomycetaceae bacterium]